MRHHLICYSDQSKGLTFRSYSRPIDVLCLRVRVVFFLFSLVFDFTSSFRVIPSFLLLLYTEPPDRLGLRHRRWRRSNPEMTQVPVGWAVRFGLLSCGLRYDPTKRYAQPRLGHSMGRKTEAQSVRPSPPRLQLLQLRGEMLRVVGIVTASTIQFEGLEQTFVGNTP